MNLMKRRKWRLSERMSGELGREEGEHRITELHKRLLDDERMEDLRKAVEDDSYQSALCREYGI